MGRERYIYPNDPANWSWAAYLQEYPIHMNTIEEEKEKIENDIETIKLKIFGLVGATPRDICNENDDPFEFVTNKLNSLLKDYKFLIKRDWRLFMIERYAETIKEGEEDNLFGTIDEDTQRPWKPYIWISGMYAENEYTCTRNIEENESVLSMLINKLTMYVTGTPNSCYESDDEATSFDSVFFDVRSILDKEDGLEYYWWQIFNWELARDNFNEESYNNC